MFRIIAALSALAAIGILVSQATQFPVEAGMGLAMVAVVSMRRLMVVRHRF